VVRVLLTVDAEVGVKVKLMLQNCPMAKLVEVQVSFAIVIPVPVAVRVPNAAA
jgi:hypothetical protein